MILEFNKFNTHIKVIATDLNLEFWKNHYHYWEDSTFNFLFKYFDKNKTFIDIGAWIGPISLVASQWSKNCVCFEPDPIAYYEFIDNIKINNSNNIFLENKAVSIYDTIKLGNETPGQSTTRDSCLDNIITCESVSINNILKKYSLTNDNISIIKIDIEGHESELLKDNQLWDLNIPMHISLHPGWKQDKDLFFENIMPFFLHKGIDIYEFKKYGDFFDITIV
jgi:FkbM family methyltransferase